MQQQDGRYWLTIQGKGNKTHRLKVHDVLYQSLAEWLAATEKPEQTKETLFEGMTRHGRLTACYANKRSNLSMTTTDFISAMNL